MLLLNKRFAAALIKDSDETDKESIGLDQQNDGGESELAPVEQSQLARSSIQVESVEELSKDQDKSDARIINHPAEEIKTDRIERETMSKVERLLKRFESRLKEI